MRFWDILRKQTGYGLAPLGPTVGRALEFICDHLDTLQEDNVRLLEKQYKLETEIAILRGQVNSLMLDRMSNQGQWERSFGDPTPLPGLSVWGPCTMLPGTTDEGLR